MRRFTSLIPLAALLLGLFLWQSHQAPVPAGHGSPPSSQNRASETSRWPASLSAQARDTLQRIERGGPFAHRQDGAVFGNYEGRLPKQPRGYYHEYTVETPGASNRGARRIITGGTPPVVWYYTRDHYRSFQRIEVQP
jgi:ribonuclease T1